MLRGYNDCINADRLAAVVLYRNLGLSVREQVGDRAVLADCCELLRELVREAYRHRHELRSFGACVAEHHALVAGAGVVCVLGSALERVVYAHCNIRGLLVDGGEYRAAISVKAVLGAGVADVADSLAHDGRNVDLRCGGDLAHYCYHTGGCEGLAGNSAHGILFKNSVEDSVGNVVADFVGMSLGYALGGE